MEVLQDETGQGTLQITNREVYYTNVTTPPTKAKKQRKLTKREKKRNTKIFAGLIVFGLLVALSGAIIAIVYISLNNTK